MSKVVVTGRHNSWHKYIHKVPTHRDTQKTFQEERQESSYRTPVHTADIDLGKNKSVIA